MYQYLKPRQRDICLSHITMANLMHNRKQLSVGIPHRPKKNTHTVVGVRFLCFSTPPPPSFFHFISWFLLTGLLLWNAPLEFYSGVKSPHLIQCIALGNRFAFSYLMLNSKQDVSVFPNSTSLPPLERPWFRRLTNL